MSTIIICIDRDDDIGVKAGIKSPIIGREANLNAAIELALLDPEESDINTIFGGLQIYDELKSKGEEVEIVSITGHPSVGVKSDRIIAEQLDQVLKQYNFEKTIVVSDGVEDELVLPLIESRVKVDSVRRVIVKQAQNLESTYYILKELFSNPKVTRTFFIPIGLALLVYALSIYLGYPQIALITILAFIGIYLLYRGVGLDDLLTNFYRSLTKSFYGGKITFVTYIAAIILTITASIQGLIEFWRYYINPVPVGAINLAMIFIKASIWWFVAAGEFIALGWIVDNYFEKERAMSRYISTPFLVFATGLLLWGASIYILSGIYEPGQLAFQQFALNILGSVAIASIGVGVSAYKRRAENKMPQKMPQKVNQ